MSNRSKRQEIRKDIKKGAPMSISRFMLIYIVLMGFFYILLGFMPLQKYLDVNDLYSRSITSITAWILTIFNFNTTVSGKILHFPGISLNVLFGCNGLETVLLYSVAIFAFPAPWKKKLIGIVVGFFIIQVINIIRIVAIAYVAVNYRELFKIIHIYVAQGFMIAVALGSFLVYLSYATKDKQLDN